MYKIPHFVELHYISAWFSDLSHAAKQPIHQQYIKRFSRVSPTKEVHNDNPESSFESNRTQGHRHAD